jgi:hypothetical protein
MPASLDASTDASVRFVLLLCKYKRESKEAARVYPFGIDACISGGSTSRRAYTRCTTGLSRWLSGKAQVGQDLAEAGHFCGIRIRYGWMHNHFIALLPASRRGDLGATRQLQRVHDAQHLVKVTPRAGGIREGEADLVSGIQDEDAAHRQGHATGCTVGGILRIQHAVRGGNAAVGIGNNGELDAALLCAQGA